MNRQVILAVAVSLLSLVALIQNLTKRGKATQVVRAMDDVTRGVVEPRWPCPLIYKYPLPLAWLENRFRAGEGQSDPPSDAFGERLPGQAGRFLTKHKSMASLLEHSLATYGSMCETLNPEEADLFWIPWWRDWFCGARPCNWYTKQSKEEDELFEYIQNFSISQFGENYFTRRDGWDHVIAWGQEIAINMAPKDMKFRRGFYANVTTMSIGYSAVIHFPYATWVHFEPGMDELPWSAKHLTEPPEVSTDDRPDDLEIRIMTVDKNPTQSVLPIWWQRRHQRRCFIAVAFGSVQGGRARIVDECKKVPDSVCTFLSTSRETFYKDGLTRSTEVADLYASATFCLNLGGDTCTRKGIFDSWTLGCIPVLFQACPAEFVRDFMDVGRSMVVLKTSDYANFVQVLSEIHPWTVREMQIYIAQNAHRLQVSRLTADDFNTLPSSEESLVLDDAFFNSFRLAHRSFLQQRDCASLGGRYEARVRVCCPLSNDCDPIAIVAVGIVNWCASKRQIPCFYDNALLFHLESRAEDNIAYQDSLRVAQPYEWPMLREQTTDAHLW
eukprot:Polyplicarium_translucidae@DN2926_c0_g1_i1.p1